MRDKRSLVEKLKKSQIFKELKEREIEEILEVAKKLTFKKGTVLFREGDPGNAMYIIVKGKVDVVKGGEKIATLKEGDFFGEMALIEEKPRSADIVISTRTTMLEINKENFEKFLIKNPPVAFRMMKILSQRLRETDITMIENLKKKNIELQEAYEELKKMQDELIKRERLSSIGMLTSRIVHDFKNPIGVIKNCTQLLLEKTTPSELREKLCRMIEKETDYILSLVVDLLELSRGQMSIKLKPVRIEEILNECLEESHQMLAERKIEKETHFMFNESILADPQRLKRGLSNIICNAIEAMNEGGKLFVETKKVKDGVEIKIKDTGKGIPKEMIDKIFEPFFTAGKEKGTGLGMTIAKSVIDAHQGKVEVKSEVGKGTEVKISLPFLPSKAQSTNP